MKNAYRIEGDTVIIELRTTVCHPETIIDSADFPLVSNIKGYWSVTILPDTHPYVEYDSMRKGKRHHIQLHKLLCPGTGPGTRVKHRDGNTLNNHRKNLRSGNNPLCGVCGGVRKRYLSKRKRMEGVCFTCQSRKEKAFRDNPDNRTIMRAKYKRHYATRHARDPLSRYRSMGADLYREIRALFDSQKGKCALSGRPITAEHTHLDHILPKTRGGKAEISNLRFVTPEANFAKRDLTDEEFISLCQDVVRHMVSAAGDSA